MIRFTPAVSILALGLAALALQRAETGSHRRREADERLARLAGELEALAAAPPLAADPPSRADLASLEARLTDLERAPDRSPARPAVPEVAAAPVEAAAPGEVAPGAVDPAERAELAELVERLIGSDYDLHGSKEEIQRFFELAREGGLLADILGELEGRVAADPEDLEARMELADAYVAKVMTVPHGPEQGVWGGRAEEQWHAVAERDPQHWAANFALGNNYSFYPDVMGMTGEAIRYLESARAIQELGPPAAEHVQTYLSLARLYVREGRRDDALSVLEAGLVSHPGNAAIEAELERLEGG